MSCRCGAPKRKVDIVCKRCWARVPAPLRLAAWRTFKAKPYNRNAHMEAVMACLRHLAGREIRATK